MKTDFCLNSFFWHFEHNTRLEIPGGQELIIKDVDDVEEISDSSSMKRAQDVINQILSMISRSAIIQFPVGPVQDILCTTKPHFVLRCPKNIRIVLKQDVVVFPRLKVLFDRMLRYSRFEVLLDQDQKIVFQEGENLESGDVNIREFPTFDATLERDVRGLRLKMQPVFLSSKAFCKELLKGPMTIRSDVGLTIRDPDFCRVLQMSSRFPRNPYYLLCQWIAPMGYKVTGLGSSRGCIQTYKSSRVQIKFNQDVEISLKDGLVVDLELLGFQLLSSEVRFIEVAQGSSIFIVNFHADSECKSIESAIQCYNPVGGVWAISPKNRVRCVMQEQRSVIHLSPPKNQGIVLSLDHPSRSKLITNILRVMNPEVLEGVNAGNEKAVKFVLFFMAWYYSFKHVSGPIHLSSETVNCIRNLKESGGFISDQKIYNILQMTPDQFDLIDPETLPLELRTVFIQMLQLVNIEMKNEENFAIFDQVRELTKHGKMVHRPLVV